MKINDGLKNEKKEKLEEKAKTLKSKNVTPLVHDIGVDISNKGKGKGDKSTQPTESIMDRLKRLKNKPSPKPSSSKPSSSKPSSSKPSKTRERTRRKD
jgi:hypothetical protein